MPIQYKAGYKYQLYQAYWCNVEIYPKEKIDTEYIELTEKGLLTIRRGYAWDGGSGPAIDSKTIMRGSLIHDSLYQLMRQGFLSIDNRKQADIELKKICKEDGMWSVRVWWVYKAVRLAAGTYALPENAKEVITAP